MSKVYYGVDSQLVVWTRPNSEKRERVPVCNMSLLFGGHKTLHPCLCQHNLDGLLNYSIKKYPTDVYRYSYTQKKSNNNNNTMEKLKKRTELGKEGPFHFNCTRHHSRSK